MQTPRNPSNGSRGPLRVAVIGTGAAGMGALSAMLRRPSNVDVTVFDIGRTLSAQAPPAEVSAEKVAEFYDAVYKEIRASYPRVFPPPKTHFAQQIPRYDLTPKGSLFRSESLGGLTNYWGGTMLPFTPRELGGWPIRLDDLAPYYQEVAAAVGISGERDRLTSYFQEEFHNRPPLKPTRMLARLRDSLNAHDSASTFKFVAGVNRCALETREELETSCVYCGECMAGCFRDSVYSSRRTIQECLNDPRVMRLIRGRVVRIAENGRAVEFESDGRSGVERGFDKIFLCAGCPASTEIIMRTFGLKSGPIMKDNAVFVFPILYLGRVPKEARNEAYIALCNLIIGCVPKIEGPHFAQVQVYPNFAYLWRYNAPQALWKLLHPVFRRSLSRVFWGRLYVHSDYSQSYAMTLDDDVLQFHVERRAEYSDPVRTLMASVRSAVNRNGFYIPPVTPVVQKTNSHYAATLPFSGELIDVSPTSEVMPGVYLCDSSCFPDAPAVSPTFTIMANAARIASEAISEAIVPATSSRSGMTLPS